MSLIRHQLKKDTRRLWPLLLLWGSLLAAQTVIGVRVWDQDLHPLGETLLSLHRLLAILLTALVILEEPMTGTRGFWLTLPLSRFDLMVSKLLFVTFYVALPAVLAELCALNSMGLELGRWPAVGAEVLLRYGAFVMLTAVLAVLSANLRAFALIGVVGLFAGSIGGHWLVLLVRQASGLPDEAQPTPESRVVLSTLLILLFGGAVVGHQYLTRNTRRSLVLLACAAPIVQLVPQIGSWEFLRPRGDFDPTSMRLVLDQPTSGFSWSGLDEDSSQKIHGLLRLEGAPAAYSFRTIRIDGRLQLEAGPTFRSTSYRFGSLGSFEQALELAVGASGLSRSHGSLSELLVLPETDYARWAEMPGTYTARIRVQAARYEVVGEMPLVAGARLESGFDRLVLEEVEIGPPRFSLRFDGRSLTLFGQPAPYFQPILLYRHPQSGEIRMPGGVASSGDSQWNLVVPQPYVRRVSLERGVDLERMTEAEIDGLRESDLVVVRRVPLRSFDLPFEIENFRMKDYTLESWQDRLARNANRDRGN